MTSKTINTESLATLNAYQLANMADVSSPDSLESAGAEFLAHVRNSVIESLEYAASEHPDYDVLDLTASIRDDSHEIADGAPSTYTYTRFQQFVDLAAWQEDISELTDGSTDMEAMAGIALYIIAERLVNALLDALESDD
jgi:hypothetical protein